MRKAFLIALIAGLGIVQFQNLPLHAQPGAWFGQSLHPQMSGTRMNYCGETVAAFTKTQSPVIYFFDVFTSKWTAVMLGGVKKISKLVVKGNVAFASTDSLLIGYSALVSQWNTLRYQGELLPSFTGDSPFGAGDNLVWFVTNTTAYIFDGALGKWREHPVSIPEDYQSGNGFFWSRDNYVAILIWKGNDAPAYLLAYSMEHHDFAEIEEGGTYIADDCKLNYGFWAYRTDGSNNYFTTGYSAFTNRFEVLSYQNSPRPSSLEMYPQNVKEYTAYAFNYAQLISPPSGCRLYCYGFDTRSGNWIEFTWDYDSKDYGFSGFLLGGQVAMLPIRNKKTGEYLYIVFSGLDNSFSIHNPVLFRDATSFGPILGGSVITDFDTTSMWFHSMKTGRSKCVAFSRENIYSPISGEKYVCYRNYPVNQPDSMHLYIFNENFDTLLTFMTPYGFGNVYTNEHIIAFGTKLPHNTVQFYSSVLHDHKSIQLPDDIEYPKVYVNGKMAFANHLNYYALYDAVTNNAYVEKCDKLTFQCGINAISLFKNGNVLSAYSSLTGKFHEFIPPASTYIPYAGTDIGVFSSLGLKMVYAFNAFTGDFVPLTDITNIISTAIGGSIAVVYEGNTIWAFTPFQTNSVILPDMDEEEKMGRLLDNYPNPFSEATTITYTIPQEGMVRLFVSNAKGEIVRMLVSGIRSTGTYAVSWDGLDGAGNPLSSGVYMLSIVGNHFREARKVFLVR